MKTAYLTTKKISEMTGVSVEEVRKWIRSGRLKAFRPGGKVLLVAESDFREFIESHDSKARKEC